MGMCGVVLDVVDSRAVVRVHDVFGMLIFGSSISISNADTHTFVKQMTSVKCSGEVWTAFF